MKRGILSNYILLLKCDTFQNTFDKVFCGLSFALIIISIMFHNYIYDKLIMRIPASICLYSEIGMMFFMVML
jgi:hypothetical protein